MPIHKLPLIMVFNVQENAVFMIHEFSKISLPPLPPLSRFAPSLWPPLTDPVCTTVTAIAQGPQA